MYLPKDASRLRQKEAQRARDNRAEIVRALGQDQISKRDLFRWGIFTGLGALAFKNGLSPYAPSAFAQVPTGTPRSPLGGARKFSAPLQRLRLQKPVPLTRNAAGEAVFPGGIDEPPARRMSYHTDFTSSGGAKFRNPLTNRGPMEGRPPGEIFAHQRWSEYFPKVGYVMSLGQVAANTRFHPSMPAQAPNSVWSYGPGRFTRGLMPPPLFKGRYGEPILTRIYNNTPVSRAENGGFGRNETQLHFHNAHNGAESDGASNVHHFPGTFYDYRWSTSLARRDKINKDATDRRASGPDGNGGLVLVPGDFRELQGTMWCHDHRFFFTAENVYKGNLGAVNYYSGRDRGNEVLNDGVNLRLPSGKQLDWGNIDFDVNLVLSDCAFGQDGQLFFDIFDTDGFLGDVPLVNMQYAPFMEVLPRKYRFRLLNACMSRFLKLAFADSSGNVMPIQFICNDGNLVVSPIAIRELDFQGVAERYDVIVDFSTVRIGDRVRLVNTHEQTNGRKTGKVLSMRDALRGSRDDPMVGPMLEFRVSGQVQSVDVPGVTLRAGDARSADNVIIPAALTEQIPIVSPVRERFIELKRSEGDSRNPVTGQCTPDCSEVVPGFPWSIRVNGESTHSFNANRISTLIPKPGEVEHWTLVNGGGGWDHPIHLHFEEGITMNRGSNPIPDTEKLVRKDVWRVMDSTRVQFQVQFGEFGGSYVTHCHNTVHEDFAMLMRIQILNGILGTPQSTITPTPNPTPDGVFYTTPEVLPEADPNNPKFFKA